MGHLVIVTDLPGRANVIREDVTIDSLVENSSEEQLNELSNRVTEMLNKINLAELKLRKKRRRDVSRIALNSVDKKVEPIY